MIIATPNGKYYSQGAREPDYKWRFYEITSKLAKHYCQASQDSIVFRKLTLREWIIVVTKRRGDTTG